MEYNLTDAKDHMTMAMANDHNVVVNNQNAMVKNDVIKYQKIQVGICLCCAPLHDTFSNSMALGHLRDHGNTI